MGRSASWGRRRPGPSRSWLFDEARQFIPVSLPAHVVGIVVAGALDHHELHGSTGGRGHLSPHGDRDEPVGSTVEDENGTMNAADRADIVQLQPHQKRGEDAVMAYRHPMCAREWRLENQ